MASQSARNEGFRVLDEFVCKAIVDPSAASMSPPSPVGKRAENEGIAITADVSSITRVEHDTAMKYTNIRFLDQATQCQLVGEMVHLRFADVPAAVKHFSYLAKSGKRFSQDDVVAILSAVGLSTEPVPAALADLVSRGILESYAKDGTTAYYMERRARIEYGESIGHPRGLRSTV